MIEEDIAVDSNMYINIHYVLQFTARQAKVEYYTYLWSVRVRGAGLPSATDSIADNIILTGTIQQYNIAGLETSERFAVIPDGPVRQRGTRMYSTGGERVYYL